MYEDSGQGIEEICRGLWRYIAPQGQCKSEPPVAVPHAEQEHVRPSLLSQQFWIITAMLKEVRCHFHQTCHVRFLQKMGPRRSRIPIHTSGRYSTLSRPVVRGGNPGKWTILYAFAPRRPRKQSRQVDDTLRFRTPSSAEVVDHTASMASPLITYHIADANHTAGRIMTRAIA